MKKKEERKEEGGREKNLQILEYKDTKNNQIYELHYLFHYKSLVF